MKGPTHDEAMVEQFHTDPAYAAELLSEVRRNGDSVERAILLRHTAKSFWEDGEWNLADAERKLLFT